MPKPGTNTSANVPGKRNRGGVLPALRRGALAGNAAALGPRLDLVDLNPPTARRAGSARARSSAAPAQVIRAGAFSKTNRYSGGRNRLARCCDRVVETILHSSQLLCGGDSRHLVFAVVANTFQSHRIPGRTRIDQAR